MIKDKAFFLSNLKPKSIIIFGKKILPIPKKNSISIPKTINK